MVAKYSRGSKAVTAAWIENQSGSHIGHIEVFVWDRDEVIEGEGIWYFDIDSAAAAYQAYVAEIES